MQSSPFPNEWLVEKVRMFENNGDDIDFSRSVWGKILLKNLQEEIVDGVNSLKLIRNKLETIYELEKYKLTIESDIEIFRKLYELIDISWDEASNFFNKPFIWKW